MSWTILTVILVAACFVCAFGLCEWIVKRTRDSSGNGGDSTAG